MVVTFVFACKRARITPKCGRERFTHQWRGRLPLLHALALAEAFAAISAAITSILG